MSTLGLSGLLALFGLVAFGAIVPVVPTGALVSAAAVIAGADMPIEVLVVIAIGAAGAYLGDFVTYAALRKAGVPLAQRLGWLKADDPAHALQVIRERLEGSEVRALLLSRLIPGGRIPVLLAAALGGYPLVRFASANVAAAVLWSTAYASIGIAGTAAVPNPTVALAIVIIGALLLSVLPGAIKRFRKQPVN